MGQSPNWKEIPKIRPEMSLAAIDVMYIEWCQKGCPESEMDPVILAEFCRVHGPISSTNQIKDLS